MAENKDLEQLPLQTAPKSKLTGNRLTFKARVRSFTRTVTFIKANTPCHKSTVKAYTYGQVIIANIKASLEKILYKARPVYFSHRNNTIQEE
jgi:hypothetical protein